MGPVVVLVGLPGAGKSTVGASLAAKLAVRFADSDEIVIEMTGRAVSEIFRRDGEQAFREIEAAAIADALLDFSGVLALGGGAVCTSSVREALHDSGMPIVWLIAAQSKLLKRMDGTSHRPLLSGDARSRLAELAAIREPLYREVATLTVETEMHTVDEVAMNLVEQLQGLKGEKK
jgi:shikimate kinase